MIRTMNKPTSRLIPARIDGYGLIRPFTGAFDNLGVVKTAPARCSTAVPGRSKILPGIEAAIKACGGSAMAASSPFTIICAMAITCSRWCWLQSRGWD